MPSYDRFAHYPSEDEEDVFFFRVPYKPPTAFGALLLFVFLFFIGIVGLGGASFVYSHTHLEFSELLIPAVASVAFLFVASVFIPSLCMDAFTALRSARLRITVVKAEPDWASGSQPADVMGRTIRIEALDRSNNHAPVNLIWKLSENFVPSIPPGREIKFYALKVGGEWHVKFAEMGVITAQAAFYQYTRLRNLSKSSPYWN